ncbi:hypothetical protein NX779_02870 [Mycoplasma cottewii]|uniref:Uncharacterized protein n=1 Tax=Mycoplasma cottewii TaxID=51364 RepID=A0ABY5U0C0_9MOLU|nr:hypothetical protein [Mycoplasma cottewii]UWD34734.1 hypothetical protein NX779_02870 [Mycoplasma cottewii]
MFKYDDALKKIVDDELLIIVDTAQSQPDFLYSLRSQWKDLNDFKKFEKWIEESFPKIKAIFISESNKPDEDYNELLLVRLRTLLKVVKDFLQTYQNLQSKDNNHDHVNEFGVDIQIRNSFYELIIDYVKSFIKELKITKNIKEFDFFSIKLLETFTKLLKTDSVSDCIDRVYSTEEILSDFIDAVEERDFELLPYEIVNANSFLTFVIYVQTTIYYLILIYETLEFKELEKIGIEDYENKLYYSERNDQVEIIKTIIK